MPMLMLMLTLMTLTPVPMMTPAAAAVERASRPPRHSNLPWAAPARAALLIGITLRGAAAGVWLSTSSPVSKKNLSLPKAGFRWSSQVASGSNLA